MLQTRLKVLQIVLITFVLLTAFSFSAQAQTALPDHIQRIQQVAMTEGSVRVIVVLRTHMLDGVADAERTAIIGQESRNLLATLAGQRVQVMREYEYLPLLALTVDSAALNTLAASPLVAAIQIDELDAPALNVSAERVQARGNDGAWARGFTGTGQTVAVLDTGVNRNHTFMSGRVVSEACYSTNSGSTVTSLCPGGATSSTATNSGLDCATTITGCGHGSHVAGIVASQDTNHRGIAPGATIISIKVFSRVTGANCTNFGLASPCALTYISDYVKGLERVYALRNNFNIAAANMSLGGGRYTSQTTCNNENPAIKTAIDNLRSVGIATVISSGNNGYTNALSRPACISTAISVGSVSKTDNVASSSNSASFLHLLAPGVSINSINSNGGNTIKGGTSMAAPHVAGAWAIIKQAKPTATVQEVLDALTATGLSITDPKNNISKRRIRINLALHRFVVPLPPTGFAGTPINPTRNQLTWTLRTGANSYDVDFKRPSAANWTTLFTGTIFPFGNHNNAVCSTRYQYRIRSVNTVGASAYSSTIQVLTERCPAPTNIQVGPFLGDTLAITWNQVTGATGYRVQRQLGFLLGNPLWITVAETGAGSTAALDLNVPCQTQRTYRVTALGNDSNSLPSAPVTGTAKDCVDSENLVFNGGFELTSDDPRIPQGWQLAGARSALRFPVNGVNTVARTGERAMVIRQRPNPNVMGGITQRLDLEGKTFAAGDTLYLSAYIRRINTATNIPVVILTVRYTDNTVQKARLRLAGDIPAPSDYELFNTTLVLESGDINRIVIRLQHPGTTGRMFFDNVAVTHAATGGGLEMVTIYAPPELDGDDEMLIPLPEAPADMRGTN